eukprot:gene3283-2265_t
MLIWLGFHFDSVICHGFVGVLAPCDVVTWFGRVDLALMMLKVLAKIAGRFMYTRVFSEFACVQCNIGAGVAVGFVCGAVNAAFVFAQVTLCLTLAESARECWIFMRIRMLECDFGFAGEVCICLIVGGLCLYSCGFTIAIPLGNNDWLLRTRWLSTSKALWLVLCCLVLTVGVRVVLLDFKLVFAYFRSCGVSCYEFVIYLRLEWVAGCSGLDATLCLFGDLFARMVVGYMMTFVGVGIRMLMFYGFGTLNFVIFSGSSLMLDLQFTCWLLVVGCINVPYVYDATELTLKLAKVVFDTSIVGNFAFLICFCSIDYLCFLLTFLNLGWLGRFRCYYGVLEVYGVFTVACDFRLKVTGVAWLRLNIRLSSLVIW